MSVFFVCHAGGATRNHERRQRDGPASPVRGGACRRPRGFASRRRHHPPRLFESHRLTDTNPRFAGTRKRPLCGLHEKGGHRRVAEGATREHERVRGHRRAAEGATRDHEKGRGFRVFRVTPLAGFVSDGAGKPEGLARSSLSGRELARWHGKGLRANRREAISGSVGVRGRA